MKRALALEAGIYALCLVLASILWRWPIMLSLAYLAISALMLSRWHTQGDLLFYFAAFVLGPCGEIVAVYFGAWTYAKPLYLIPVWLPFLWGIAALFMKKLAETLLTARPAA